MPHEPGHTEVTINLDELAQLQALYGAKPNLAQESKEKLNAHLLALRNAGKLSEAAYARGLTEAGRIGSLPDQDAVLELARLVPDAGAQEPSPALVERLTVQLTPKQQLDGIIKEAGVRMLLGDKDIQAVQTTLNRRFENQAPAQQDETLRRIIVDGDVARVIEGAVTTDGAERFEKAWRSFELDLKGLRTIGLSGDYVGVILEDIGDMKEQVRSDFLAGFLDGYDSLLGSAEDIQNLGGQSPSAALFAYREQAATNWLRSQRLGILRDATPLELRPREGVREMAGTDDAFTAYEQAIAQNADRGSALLTFYDAKVKALETASQRGGNPNALALGTAATRLRSQRSSLVRQYLQSTAASPVDFLNQSAPLLFSGAFQGTSLANQALGVDFASTVDSLTAETPQEMAADKAKTELETRRKKLEAIAANPVVNGVTKYSARQVAAAQKELAALGTTSSPGAPVAGTPPAGAQAAPGAPVAGAAPGPGSVLDEAPEGDIPPEVAADHAQFMTDVNAGFTELLQPGEKGTPTLRKYYERLQEDAQASTKDSLEATSLNIQRARTRDFYYNKFQVAGSGQAAAPQPTPTSVTGSTPPGAGLPPPAAPAPTAAGASPTPAAVVRPLAQVGNRMLTPAQVAATNLGQRDQALVSGAAQEEANRKAAAADEERRQVKP